LRSPCSAGSVGLAKQGSQGQLRSVLVCRKPDWLANLKVDLQLVKAAEQAWVLEQT